MPTAGPGPAAQAIARRIWWVLFWGALAIYVVVMALVVVALIQHGGALSPSVGRGLIVAGFAMTTSLLIALLIYGAALTPSTHATGASVDHTVLVRARQWQRHTKNPEPTLGRLRMGSTIRNPT